MISLYEMDSIWSPVGLFEVFELLMLLEPRSLLYHLAGITVGCVAVLWLPASPAHFPGDGVPLGGDRGRQNGGEERWTRSWGYANYRPGGQEIDRGRGEDEEDRLGRGTRGRTYDGYGEE